MSVFKLTGLSMMLNIICHVVCILLGPLVISRATCIFTPRLQNMFYAVMLLGPLVFLV